MVPSLPCHPPVPVRVALLPIFASLMFPVFALAATPPIIDGNLDDMITFVNQVIAEKIGNGLTTTDPAKDICKSDSDIYPCPGGNEESCPSDPAHRTYFRNGYDLILAVAAYDQTTQTLYLGTRAAGVIGDVDGDQTPGDGGCAPPPGRLDINDGSGIGNNELYVFYVDFDCGQNGSNELRVELDDDTLFVNSVPQPRSSWAFNGSDLEIRIPGQVLPLMWSISMRTGASEDGLEEESLNGRTPGPPPLDLSILKSAEPTAVCPEGSTIFTVTVTNTGEAPLDVYLTDQLPADLSYVSMDPSSDFSLSPDPPADPHSLVFTTLSIAPGEARVARFVARASGQCSGAAENVATAAGVFTAACLPPPGTATVGPIEARATVVCAGAPDLSTLCQISQLEADSGDVITVTGKATNTSTAVENITLRVFGPTGTVLCEQTFNGVAPGAEVSLPCQVTVECEPDQTVTYKVDALAVNDCGQERKETSESCSVYCPPQGTNCPRTVGFWGQQCAQKTGGSMKFTKDEVTQIAACIDAESAAFDWSNDFDGFCGVINPPRPMDCKKQAHRQFAALLANYCTGKLALIANNGNEISLDPSSPNPCKDSFPDAMNLGELIDAMDAKLVELNGMGADAMDHGYCMVSECADGINNGRGLAIDPDCSEETAFEPRHGGADLEIHRATPNPFVGMTVVSYSISGDGRQVKVGIYDVAGRLVRSLADGRQSPGLHEASWDGRNEDGVPVRRGTYFVRVSVDGNQIPATARILYLR